MYKVYKFVLNKLLENYIDKSKLKFYEKNMVKKIAVTSKMNIPIEVMHAVIR